VPAPRSGEGGRRTRLIRDGPPGRRATATRFYLYSELDAKEGVVSGYVKPLFKDLQIYSKQQDKDKSAFRLPAAQRAPEGLLQGRERLTPYHPPPVAGKAGTPVADSAFSFGATLPPGAPPSKSPDPIRLRQHGRGESCGRALTGARPPWRNRAGCVPPPLTSPARGARTRADRREPSAARHQGRLARSLKRPTAKIAPTQ
jgi:hypothetical protein